MTPKHPIESRHDQRERINKALIERRHGEFAERYAERVADELLRRITRGEWAEGVTRDALRKAVLDGAVREHDMKETP